VIVQLPRPRPCGPGIVDQGIALLLSARSADPSGPSPARQTPYKMWRLGDDGRLVPLLEMNGQEPHNYAPPAAAGHVLADGSPGCRARRTVKDPEALTGRVIYPLIIDAVSRCRHRWHFRLDRAEALIGSGRLRS
jgi:hypothetical protein